MSVKDVKDALALAQSVRIEAPQPLKKRHQQSKFPLHCLSDELSAVIMDVHKKAQAPIPIAVQSILATINLVVQGHANILTPWDDIKPISCYFMTIAASGQRKTTCDNKALKQIREYERRLNSTYNDELKLWKKTHAIWKSIYDSIIRNKKLNVDSKNNNLHMIGQEPKKPLLPYLTCTDPTFEGLYKLLNNGQPSIGLFSSEGGQFLGGYSMNKDNKIRTAAALSSIWDGNRLDRVRGSDEITSIYNKRLCMHLMIQPDIARSFLYDGILKNQGLLSRLLISSPPQLEEVRFVDSLTQTTNNLDGFYRKINDILNIKLPLDEDHELDPRTITMPNELKKYCFNYYEKIQTRIASGELDSINDFANKALEHVLRLATTLSLFDDINTKELDYKYIRNSIEIIEYYIQEMKVMADSSKLSGNLILAEKLLQWLTKHFKDEYISIRDMCQRCHAINTREEALKAIYVLESHGWLSRVNGDITISDTIKKEVWKVVRV